METLRNLGAEKALLGLILVRNDSLFDIGSLLPEDFAEPGHEEIYRLLKDQIEGGRRVTADLLLLDIQDAEIATGKKASVYLRELEDGAPPDPALGPELSRTIRDAALRRKLVAATEAFRERVIAAPVSIPAVELREQYEETVSGLFQNMADMGIRQIGEVGDSVLGRIKNAKEAVGMPVGLAALQELTGPLQPGRLYMVGGGPGSGKSSLLVQVARFVGQTEAVLIYSPEMDAEEIVERNLAADTGISSERIESALILNTEFETLYNANEGMRSQRVFVDASPKPAVASIRGRAMRQKRLTGLGAVFIDHVHYLSKSDRRASDHEALNENLEYLKAMAKDLDVAVVAACQFSTEALRRMAEWPFRDPNQGDLLFSGIVERHADVVLLVHRAEYFLERNRLPEDDRHFQDWQARLQREQGLAKLILTKRRGGKGWGRRTLSFDAPRYTFTDAELKRLPNADDGFSF